MNRVCRAFIINLKKAISTKWKLSVLEDQGLAATSVLLANIIDQISVHTKRSGAIAIKNIDELITNIEVHKITDSKKM